MAPARALAPDSALTIAAHTLGADCTFAERVAAAAAAGFAGIGLRAENYHAARAAGLSDRDLLAILRESRVAVTEVEFVDGWGTEADRDPTQRAKEATVLHMAALFDVPHVNAGLLRTLPEEEIVAGLLALCARAGAVEVGLEFLPYSGIPTMRAAGRILARCPRAGLIVDAWHWARSGATPAELRAVAADRIVAVQLCDVRPEPMTDAREEALHHRLPPGHGTGDVPGLLAALRAVGAAPRVVSVEIASDELRRRGIGHAASVAARTAREVLG